MTDILKMDKLHKDAPIMVTSIPKLIMDEIDEWVVECRKIKDHPLSELKLHQNVGSPTNTYQTSVPTHLIENSFWLAWVLRLTSIYWKDEIDVPDDWEEFECNTHPHRFLHLKKQHGHFDGCPVWTNFSYKGNFNESHQHDGFVSGVIYYKNHEHPTIFDEHNIGYVGTDKTMVLFKSDVRHHVEKQLSDEERITIAFNIYKLIEFKAIIE